MADAHLEKAARIRIERRLPKLIGVHFPQPLVPADRDPLSAELHHRVDQRHRPGHGDLGLADLEARMLGVGGLQLRRHRVQPMRLAALDQSEIDGASLGDARDGACEGKAAIG